MPVGRPVLPDELKRAKGTLRADRATNGSALLTGPALAVPEPIEPLGEAGLAFWQTAYSVSWISATSDLYLVQLLASGFDERQALKTALEQDLANRPLRASLRELDKQLISGLSLLGFTPSDRSRLGLSEIKTETKLEALLRKRDERLNKQAV
jgi:hypothetical protein